MLLVLGMALKTYIIVHPTMMAYFADYTNIMKNSSLF